MTRVIPSSVYWPSAFPVLAFGHSIHVRNRRVEKHYNEQVARDREKCIKELEEKYKNKKINKTVKPSAYSSFYGEFRNREKSEWENIGDRNGVVNRSKKETF